MTRWFITFFARNTPTCKEVVRMISDSIERQPPVKQRIAVRLHFLICKWCARYKKQLLLIRKLLRGDPNKIEANAPGSLSREAR